MLDKQKFVSKLVTTNDTKIVLLVMDGLGDIPVNGKTPLQAASTPNLDSLAKRATLARPFQSFPASLQEAVLDTFHFWIRPHKVSDRKRHP